MSEHIIFTKEELTSLLTDLQNTICKLRCIETHIQYRLRTPIPISIRVEEAERMLKEGLLTSPKEYFEILNGEK